MHRRVHQPASIEVGNDSHIFRKDPLVQLRHGLVHPGDHARSVFALQHQDNPGHRVALIVLAKDAVAFVVAQGHGPDVLDEHRNAVGLCDHDVSEVLQVAYQADPADHEPLLAAVQNAATGIGIVGGNRLRDLAVRQVVLRQGCRVQFKQELRGQTAEILGFDDAGHLLQARNHRPQLQFGKFAQGPDFRFERVAIDFADRRRQRIQLWHRAVRQRHGTEALLQALARPVVLGAVLEDDGDQRQVECALGAHHVHARCSHDPALERDRDLLLDLLRSEAVDLGDDLRGRVGDVGVGLERQLLPGIEAVCGSQQEHQRDDPAPVEA